MLPLVLTLLLLQIMLLALMVVVIILIKGIERMVAGDGTYFNFVIAVSDEHILKQLPPCS